MSTSALLPGAPHFAYRDGQLQVEGLPLEQLARQHGTPLFVYSRAAMLAALGAYQRGFAGRQVKVCYAMKASSSLAITRISASVPPSAISALVSSIWDSVRS